MAAKKARSFNAFLIVFIILVVAAGAWFINSQSLEKKLGRSGSTYPDNSALGVTYNFYQWYTGCLEEAKEDNENGTQAIRDCYKNTTYLTLDEVKSLDFEKKPILCGKDLDFHEVAVKTRQADTEKTIIDVTNSKTGEFISEVTTSYLNKQWQITGISCAPAD